MNVMVYYDGDDEQDKKEARRIVNLIEEIDGEAFEVYMEDENDQPDPDPPCNHYDALVGTVGTKLEGNAPHASAVSCADCVVKTQGWAMMKTGLPAEPLLTFEDARKQHA